MLPTYCIDMAVSVNRAMPIKCGWFTFFRPTHRSLQWHRMTFFIDYEHDIWYSMITKQFHRFPTSSIFLVSLTLPSRFQKMCTNSHIFPNRILPLHYTCTVEAGDTEEGLSWLPQMNQASNSIPENEAGYSLKSWQLRFDAGSVDAWLMTSSTLYRLSYVRKYHKCCCPCASCGSTCSLCWCPCLLSVTLWGTTNIY